MRLLLRIVLNGIGLWLVSLLPGVHWQIDLGSARGLLTLFGAGVLLGLLNLIVKPILTFFSLPLILITFGLFYLVVNGLVLALAAWLMKSLSIDGLLWAILGGVVLSIFNLLVKNLTREAPPPRRAESRR